MPGIAGVISPASPDECVRHVRTMIGSMMHERSYLSGTHFVPEMGVYGGWVAHDESFAARLAAQGERNGVALLFAGECFPPTLRPGQTGSPGEPGGNTEWTELVSRYEQEGEAFVGRLNGLFSGLLVDRQRRRTWLFNDRYGMERIYHYQKNGTTFFASEAKALLRVLPELRAFDDEGVAQFLNYGCTLDGRTLFRNLRFLPGGSHWTFDGAGASRHSRYFRPEDWESQTALGEEAFELEFEEMFGRVLPAYLYCDAAVGISLTGGLDTRMIMACMPEGRIKPVSYTFAGLAGETLDVRLAARVSRVCGLEHHVLRIGPDFLSEFGRHVDRTVYITDGCAGAMAAHEIYLNALARRLSGVRVTGNFGSEILRSMSTFKPIGLARALINADFSRTMGALVQEEASGEGHPVTVAAFREIPWHLFGTLAAGRSQLTFRTPYLDNDLVKLAFRAPPQSRHSPRAALRVVNDGNPKLGRIPTDRGLVWGERGIPRLMRRLFAEATFKLDYLHKEGLPHWLSPLDGLIGSLSEAGLLGLHKFLPYRHWFRRELAGHVRDVLSDSSTSRLPYWDAGFLASMAADHIAGRRNYIREIHAVLSFEAAERTLLRETGDARGADRIV